MHTNFLLYLALTLAVGASLRAEEPAKADAANAPQFPKPPETAKLSAKDLERVEALIKQLSSESYNERARADSQLRELGAAPSQSLEAALKFQSDPEVRERIQHILDSIVPEMPTYKELEGPALDHANALIGQLESEATAEIAQADGELRKLGGAATAPLIAAIKRGLKPDALEHVSRILKDSQVEFWDLYLFERNESFETALKNKSESFLHIRLRVKRQANGNFEADASGLKLKGRLDRDQGAITFGIEGAPEFKGVWNSNNRRLEGPRVLEESAPGPKCSFVLFPRPLTPVELNTLGPDRMIGLTEAPLGTDKDIDH